MNGRLFQATGCGAAVLTEFRPAVPELFAVGDEVLAFRDFDELVGQESIALRPGAHAYVAKPGRVPLHTDHPEVTFIGWLAEAQDATDGSTEDLTPLPRALS